MRLSIKYRTNELLLRCFQKQFCWRCFKLKPTSQFWRSVHSMRNCADCIHHAIPASPPVIWWRQNFGRHSPFRGAIRNQLKIFSKKESWQHSRLWTRNSPGIGWKKCWSWQYGFGWKFDDKIFERWKDECRLLDEDFMSIDSFHKKYGKEIIFDTHPTLGPCATVAIDFSAYPKAKAAHMKAKEQKFIKKYGTLEIKWHRK